MEAQSIDLPSFGMGRPIACTCSFTSVLSRCNLDNKPVLRDVSRPGMSHLSLQVTPVLTAIMGSCLSTKTTSTRAGAVSRLLSSTGLCP